MLLTPVTSRTRLALSDRAAAAPDELLSGPALKEALKAEVEELGRLQALLYADRRYALLVVLQGRDASGKDGTIRKVFDGCNPMGCQVTSFGVPTALELAHDFLWRIHAAVPPRGFVGIFNRSHYEDVLAVRVRHLAPPSVWRARYGQINDFERMLARNNVVVLKFLLHISRAEQRERLLDRLRNPRKNWKFNPGDLEERGRWGAYTSAYRDVLRRCSTSSAPWFVVPADSNTVRNYLVTTTINATLRRLKLRYPRVSPAVRRLAAALK